MENYLVLNGQKIELTPEQYQEVCNAVTCDRGKKEKSPFGKQKPLDQKHYYYIDDVCDVREEIDSPEGWFRHTRRYKCANYCTDMKLMKKRANYEALERVLWRFSEENGGAGSYTIYIDIDKNRWGVLDIRVSAVLFGPTFCSRQAANEAIEVAKEWLSRKNLEPEDVFF